MGKVIIYRYEKKPGTNEFRKVEDCIGIFHQFGVGCEEYDNGAGNFSTAIVEIENGEVRNVPVELIKFLD